MKMKELLEKTLAVDMNEFDIKKGLRTAATAGLIGAGAFGLGAKKGLFQRGIEKPETFVKVEQPVKDVSIDMNKIGQIESSNNPKAENKRSGARGLCQIVKSTWLETTKKMGVMWSWDSAFNEEANKKVADYYMNKEIPRLLRYYKIDDTIENRLAAYNWGAGNLSRKGIEKAPQETVNYIEKYMR